MDIDLRKFNSLTKVTEVITDLFGKKDSMWFFKRKVVSIKKALH
jgi:hypothetical protein